MTPESKTTMGTTAAEPVATTTDSDDGHFLTWLQARSKPIAIAAGVVFVLALVVWYVVESGKRKQAVAMEALDQARAAMEAGNYPEASTGLTRVVTSFSGSDAAYEATLALNQVRLLSGQAELAVEELKKFIATNPPASFAGAAHAHLAMALENTGKTADATAEYLKAAELSPEAFKKVDALLAAARTYRIVGKNKEAAAVLEGIIKDFPKEQAGIAEARVRLAEIQ